MATNASGGNLVLDKTDSLVLTKETAGRFHNDLNARASFWEGLEFLYVSTRRIEKALVPENKKGSTRVTWGDIPGVALQMQRRLSCFFDWYSVSACNFVLLTGWIAESCGVTSENKNNYRQRVIPTVLAHRNKIGAHPSRIWPKGDGIATQEASNFRQLALLKDRFVANCMVLTRRAGNMRDDSGVLTPWSLTETHEGLRARYAPAQGDPPDG